MGDVTRIAKESFEAPRLVKVYEAQAHLQSQFEAVNEHNRRSYMRLILTRGLANPTVQMVTAAGGAFVLGLALRDTVAGRMSPGDLLGFFVALTSIAQPLRELVSVADPVQQGVAAAESLFELIDEPPEPTGGAYVAGRARGDVGFREVTFSYPRGERPASARSFPGRAVRLQPRHRGTVGQREIDVGEPPAEVLRCHLGLHPHRRPRHPRVRRAQPAGADRRRQSGRDAVQRHHPEQHRLRPQGVGE